MNPATADRSHAQVHQAIVLLRFCFQDDSFAASPVSPPPLPLTCPAHACRRGDPKAEEEAEAGRGGFGGRRGGLGGQCCSARGEEESALSSARPTAFRPLSPELPPTVAEKTAVRHNKNRCAGSAAAAWGSWAAALFPGTLAYHCALPFLSKLIFAALLRPVGRGPRIRSVQGCVWPCLILPHAAAGAEEEEGCGLSHGPNMSRRVGHMRSEPQPPHTVVVLLRQMRSCLFRGAMRAQQLCPARAIVP